MGVRVTQVAVEAIEQRVSTPRITQVAIEAIEQRSSTVRVTQIAIEVIRSARIPTDYPVTVEDTVTVISDAIGRSSDIFVTVEDTVAITSDGEVLAAKASDFTGILGISHSQLGIFVLGEPKPLATVRLLVESNVGVTQSISAESTHDPFRIVVAHSIRVASAIQTGSEVAKTVSDTIVVGSSPLFNRTFQLTVANTVVVAQAITTRNTTTRATVSSSIAVAQAVTPRNAITRQTVNQSISVTPLVIVRGRDVLITINHSVGVVQTISSRNTVVRLSVVSAIAASVGDSDERNTINRQTINQNISVAFNQVALSDRMIVNQNVLVTSTVIARNTNARHKISQIIALNQTITAMNPNLKVAHSIGVGQTITARSTVIHKTVSHSIALTELIRPTKTPLDVTVESIVQIPQFLSTAFPIKIRNDRPRHVFGDVINVTGDIFGGNNHREVTIADAIAVVGSFRTPWQFVSLGHLLTLKDLVQAGNSAREVSIEDTVLVGSEIEGHGTPIRVTVEDKIVVLTKITPKGPIVLETVNHTLYIQPIFRERVIPVLKVSDRIKITPLIKVPENRQHMGDSLQVGQRARSTPINVNVNNNVHINERSQTIHIIVRNNISVGTKFWKQQDFDLTDSLPLTQALNRKVRRGRDIEDDLPIVQTLNRFMIWTANLSDTLIFPETSFSKKFSFWPDPVDVPVFHGGLMSNLVVFECEGDAITLPAALLGDTKANVDKITIQRSMNAKTLTLINSSDRQKLLLKFRISLHKSFELREFMLKNQSGKIRFTDWNGATWLGYFIGNPFQHTHTGRSSSEGEYVNVDIQFEGAKVGG